MKTIFKFLTIIILAGTAQTTQTSDNSTTQPNRFFSRFNLCCCVDQNSVIQMNYNSNSFSSAKASQVTIIPLTDTTFLVSSINAQGDATYKKYTKVVRPQKTDQELAQEKEERMQRTIHAINNSSRHGLSSQGQTDRMNSILYGPSFLNKK